MAAGIEVRHARSCGSRSGAACNCRKTYQAHVYSARDGKRIRRTFPTLAAAKAWRQDAQVALRRGTMLALAETVQQAWDRWLAAAEAGSATNRSGDPYKPSVVRGYQASMKRYVLPALGRRRLSELRVDDVQALADALRSEGLSPSTVRNALMPLRVVCRRARLPLNPTHGLELAAVRGRRERIASPAEAAALLAALPVEDRALWATALYAGLRRGELLALRWSDIDLGAGIIHVERSWDVQAGAIEPKSQAGERRVPIPAGLKEHLIEHRLRQGRGGEGLVFGRSARTPFTPDLPGRRARRVWEGAGLAPIGLHECRHTYASLMIAAGVNAKALSTYMGHANIAITLDRYGHLMPGNEEEAAGLLDAYLERGLSRRVSRRGPEAAS